ncbi:MAG: CHC2 zinc finger domain-containing protein [Gammaproteobacteria bacterium]
MSARFRPDAGFWDAYGKLYRRPESRYRRELLPDPLTYYRRHLHTLHVRGQWADARCPFHEDAHASLSVLLTHGGYKCHACGAKGGDVLDFHRRLHGMDFVTAAKDLGAWEEA